MLVDTQIFAVRHCAKHHAALGDASQPGKEDEPKKDVDDLHSGSLKFKWYIMVQMFVFYWNENKRMRYEGWEKMIYFYAHVFVKKGLNSYFKFLFSIWEYFWLRMFEYWVIGIWIWIYHEWIWVYDIIRDIIMRY